MKARTQAAVELDAARFDWDEYNRQFDQQLDALRQTLAEVDAIERALTQAHLNMASDIRALIEGVTP